MKIWENSNIYFEVGETFTIEDDVELICETSNSRTCAGCYFMDLFNGGDVRCKHLVCSPSGREDKRHVIFAAI